MDTWSLWFDVEVLVRFLHLGGMVKDNAEPLLRSSSIVDNLKSPDHAISNMQKDVAKF